MSVKAMHARLRYVKLRLFLFSTERQTRIEEFEKSWVEHIYVPIPDIFKARKGLAEKHLKRRLEKNGWEVWRGGLINVLRAGSAYPNVGRKYGRLCSLIVSHRPGMLSRLQFLCHVHHGMPDFICFRRGEFRFVECKLGYEQLSSRQKKCIKALLKLGFRVEVHKLITPSTKLRRALVDILKGDKMILESQMTIKQF